MKIKSHYSAKCLFASLTVIILKHVEGTVKPLAPFLHDMSLNTPLW